MKNKPKVFKAILTSILAFIVFALVYIAAYLIFGGLILLLSKIPLIGSLVDLIFYFRGDSPDLMLSLLCPGIAYIVTMATQAAVNKDAPTRGLCSILLGVGIVLLQAVSLVLNLIYGESIWTNIVLIITGCIIFSSGYGEIKED